MKIKNSGIIAVHNLEDFGIDQLIIPALFLGRILPHAPEYAALGAGTFTEGEAVHAEELIGLSRFKAGQFIFEHQFAGHVCDNRLIMGIFLPLNICDSDEIRNRLLRVTREFRPQDPYFAKMKRGRWQEFLLETGPLKSSDDDFEEAFIRFNAMDAYAWVKEHFKYIADFRGLGNDDLQKRVAEIPGLDSIDLNNVVKHTWGFGSSSATVDALQHIFNESRESRKIGETQELPWSGLGEFAEWLSPNDNLRIAERDISIALMYQNSD